MISICFTWFPIGGLGKPNVYHDSGVFCKSGEFYLEMILDSWMIVQLVLLKRFGNKCRLYSIPIHGCETKSVTKIMIGGVFG